MYYKSTRSNENNGITASFAIKKGLADDGGLYMPSEIPELTLEEIKALCPMNYAERAAFILGKFLNDYTAEELIEDCEAAYSEASFEGGAAQLRRVNDNIFSLELWHGPTCAFKDMALQIMPRLLSRALVKNGEKRTSLILVATSGDTGKAALEGYKNIPQIKIIVFYPEDGVSRVQKLQMATQEGDNVEVVAINGNFDDAQSGVKRIFSDKKITELLDKENVFLSSANSINWGRLAPQIAYYVSAYCDLVSSKEISLGDKINVCVPTGNFGNIFAAYIAKKMGLPVEKFVCASNSNNILTDFLASGTYDRNRKFYTTISPSMDILISSNLERLLYLTCGADKTAAYMKSLNETGKYTVDAEDFEKIKTEFVGYFANEDTTKAAIKSVYNTYDYVIDTHTAVGYCAASEFAKENPDAKIVLASTASPYKFACDVFKSLNASPAKDEVSALAELRDLTGTKIPMPLDGIGERSVRFTRTIEPSGMADAVIEFAKN